MAITNKIWVNGSSPQLDDVDLNNIVSESDNLIESSGQTLNILDQTQTAKAAAIYTAGSDFYADSGTANAYILMPVEDFEAPIEFFDGMRVRFKAANTNTGASAVNVNNIGTVDIKNPDGTPLIATQIVLNNFYEMIYSSGDFVLLNNESSIPKNFYAKVYLGSNQVITANNTYTKILYNTAFPGENAFNIFDTANHRGIVPVGFAGRWGILAKAFRNINATDTATNAVCRFSLYKNGSALELIDTLDEPTIGGQLPNYLYWGYTEVVLADNDYIEGYFLANKDGTPNNVTLAGATGSYFLMRFLGI